jgi:hypothetical protein
MILYIILLVSEGNAFHVATVRWGDVIGPRSMGQSVLLKDQAMEGTTCLMPNWAMREAECFK